MKTKLLIFFLFISITATYSQTFSGSFRVGGASSSYYPVLFSVSGVSGTSSMGKLSIYNGEVHANGTWSGSFHSDIEFIPAVYGNMPTKIAQITYITGSGTPYNDPIGDIADGSTSGSATQLVVWLRGGANYQWSTTYNSRVSLQDGNTAGTSKTNASGDTLAVLTTQSQLVAKAKNNKYFQSVGLGTDGNGYFGGNVGIGCDPGLINFRVYKADLPVFEIASSVGRLQLGEATCNGCMASGAKIGDAVIRPFSGNLILSIPNNNNDGNSYIGINDEANNFMVQIY